MASIELLASSTIKSPDEALPRQSERPFFGNCSYTQAKPSQSMTDFRTGESFNHLKLTAEKMMQEQAGVKSDLQILKTKLQKSEDRVRTLESKVQDMNSENAMLKIKHKQDMKLWEGIDWKFQSTTTFCDQLAKTLQMLDCQVQEADRSKNYLEDKLAERLEFFEHTECRLNDLLEKKQVAEDSVTQCQASNSKLRCTIQEMEQTILSDSTKFEKLAVEKDCLQQELTTALKTNEDNEAIVRSTRCEIQHLQNELICKAKEATDLQNLNLTLRHRKGELELEVNGLQSHVATTLKDKEVLQHELEMFKLKMTDLEKANASAAVNIENLLAEKTELNRQSEQDKIALGKVANELKQQQVKYEMDTQVIKHQLQEAIKEKERLVAVVGEKESNFASLEEEISRLCQERIEKNQLISCMLQNAESLTLEKANVQEKLAAAEELVKSLEVKFNLELKLQQGESSKRLDNVSQRYNEEIADTRRKCEEQIKEAIANERLKGEDALKAVKQSSDEKMAKEVKAFDKRWRSVQEDCERRISSLREGHEEEKMKIAAIYADQIQKSHDQLHRVNATISKLREGHEEEKMKIVSIHSDEIQKMKDERENLKKTISELGESHEEEKTKIDAFHTRDIHKLQEELLGAKETRRSNIADLHNLQRKIEEIGQFNQEEVEDLHHDYQSQLQTVSLHSLPHQKHSDISTNVLVDTAVEITEEKSKLHEAMKEMQIAHEELLIREKQAKKTQFEKLEKDQQVQSHKMQHSLNQEISKWRSKASGLEVELKEALQQIATKEVLKEDKPIQIVKAVYKMTTSEELITKDIPTPIVTPITKDKEPQQPNQRFQAVRRIIQLEDTTDEDSEAQKIQKQAPQEKANIQRHTLTNSRKRKVYVRDRPTASEVPRVNNHATSRKKALDIHRHKAMQQRQASTDSTKPAEDGSSGNKMTSMRKDNETQQLQQVQLHPHSMPHESRRKTTFKCTQESDRHPSSGPTYQKGFGHEVLGNLSSQGKDTAPKRRGRKSTKNVTQEKNQFTRADSPTVSDLFQMDELLPYYKGDDPYALD